MALDLAEHGYVGIVVWWRPLLQLRRLRLAVEELKPEIEIGQQAEAEQLRAALVCGWRGSGRGRLQLGGRGFGDRCDRHGGLLSRRRWGLLESNGRSSADPIADVGRWLPHEVQRENYGYFSDPEMIDIYNRMLKETDTTKARELMRQFDTRINQQAHQLAVTYWYRVVPMRSYVKGWKISPSHYLNQDLANIWLDK